MLIWGVPGSPTPYTTRIGLHSVPLPLFINTYLMNRVREDRSPGEIPHIEYESCSELAIPQPNLREHLNERRKQK